MQRQSDTQLLLRSVAVVKILIIGTLEIITVTVLKNQTVWFYYAAVHPKYEDVIANIVGPDQTAPFGAV